MKNTYLELSSLWLFHCLNIARTCKLRYVRLLHFLSHLLFSFAGRKKSHRNKTRSSTNNRKTHNTFSGYPLHILYGDVNLLTPRRAHKLELYALFYKFQTYVFYITTKTSHLSFVTAQPNIIDQEAQSRQSTGVIFTPFIDSWIDSQNRSVLIDPQGKNVLLFPW